LPFFLDDLLRATIALFVVVDPFSIVPIILGLTSKLEPGDRKKTLNTWEEGFRSPLNVIGDLHRRYCSPVYPHRNPVLLSDKVISACPVER
jgi:hypothetical protein